METKTLINSLEETGLVNIGGSPDDEHHRYKRPLLQVERKKQRVSILNGADVVRALGVPLGVVGKYLSVDLHCRAVADEAQGTITLSGVDPLDNNLELAMDRFIAAAVLCVNCGAPELTHAVGHTTPSRGGSNKKGKKGRDHEQVVGCCRACGFDSQADLPDKVTRVWVEWLRSHDSCDNGPEDPEMELLKARMHELQGDYDAFEAIPLE